ncbi:MAG: hypothetical protein ACYS8W_17760 [Planctomycetota bacterium]
MKHLPLKLGIFVVLLFAVVIVACLAWSFRKRERIEKKIIVHLKHVKDVLNSAPVGAKPGVTSIESVLQDRKKWLIEEAAAKISALGPDAISILEGISKNPKYMISVGAAPSTGGHADNSITGLAKDVLNLLRSHGGKTGEELRKESK